MDATDDFFGFHPLITEWFASRFEAPTEPQQRGWPNIAAGKHTLIAAPTGSGKTLTGFLACIDRLVKEAESKPLPDEFRVIYVSPLRALSNDMHRNLTQPLKEILQLGQERELPANIRVGVRTGDTPSHRRAALVRRPPHILVTTPESLYLMLTAEQARKKLVTVDTVIVDEIHALIRDKRGSHLALSLERLESLVEKPLQRIGLSATQKPLDRVARFLCGNRPSRDPGADAPCAIIDAGHQRDLDLAVETPETELNTVCLYEQWAEIEAKLVEMIRQHTSTLIFVNTRKLAERLTHELVALLGEGVIATHHGSLSATMRHDAERKLKAGELKAVVATSSLELGIDIGAIDLVVQIGSPRSIASFLQRVGRSGHALGLVPKGRLFALTRDEFLEACALVRAIKRGKLDAPIIPKAPLDILAQQIVAEVAAQEWNPNDLFELLRRADPYRDLPREKFDRVVEYLAEGITQAAGRSRVYLHHDHVNERLRPRKGARIAAATGGGAIPEPASYRVVLEPEETVVGTLDEHFAVETRRGDIFLLGTSSWRILGFHGTDLRVEDAKGLPPTVPFWEGEAPGRTWELSEELSSLREELEVRVDDLFAAKRWLMRAANCEDQPAQHAVEYIAAQKAAVGFVPNQRRILFERFFDESGGMQLVVHAPFGSAICKAWGLAMRKRFCRSFDFELQATADENGFILSLGPQHSFPIESLFPMLRRENARGLLEQAMLTTPFFQVRWRWNVTRSLLVMRMQNGKRVPPALQRFRADDLMTAVFPKLTGCQEEHVGDHEIPDHPLTQQTIHDCLFEAVDFAGLTRVLERVENGEIEFIARDTREPSPFSYQLLNANQYAFLDGDNEFQERRARAVSTRRGVDAEDMRDLGKLDAEAINQVRREAAPFLRNRDELHDMLMTRLIALAEETPEADAFFAELVSEQRAGALTRADGKKMWFPAERLPAVRSMFPERPIEPGDLTAPRSVRQDWDDIESRVAAVRGLVEISGPVSANDVAWRVGIKDHQAFAALEALEGEGLVLRGSFTAHRSAETQMDIEWCHRRLLARIHKLTLEGLRKQIEPVDLATYFRFLFDHHGLTGDQRSGTNGLYETVSMLQGIDLPAVAWERDVLPLRLSEYESAQLDELCLAGEVGWARLFPPKRDDETSRPASAITRSGPVSLWLREDRDWLFASREETAPGVLSGPATEIYEILQDRGASFAADLASMTSMLPDHLKDALGELVARGLVASDGFSGLRFLATEKNPARSARRNGSARVRSSQYGAGRWSLLLPQDDLVAGRVEQWAWQLLRRWGVVFRDLLAREAGAPSWFELVQVFRRLEARGELRGGWFIKGVGGEQFALAETVTRLRKAREKKGGTLVISAADPLNLVGLLTEDERVPATAANRVAFANGIPVAALRAGKIEIFGAIPPPFRQSLLERLEAPTLLGHRRTTTGEPNRKEGRLQYPNGIPRPVIS